MLRRSHEYEHTVYVENEHTVGKETGEKPWNVEQSLNVLAENEHTVEGINSEYPLAKTTRKGNRKKKGAHGRGNVRRRGLRTPTHATNPEKYEGRRSGMKNDRSCIQKLNGVEAKLKNEQNTLSELCADGPMAELNKVLNKNVEKGEEKSEAELNNEGDQEAEPNTSELRLGGPNTEVNNAVEKSVEKCVEMSETELNTVSELRVGGTHD